MSLLVVVSALGAMNGLIFTSSRVYAALGADHSLFALLGRWHPRLHSPVWSLLTQAALTLLMIVAVGTANGQRMLDGLLVKVGLNPLSWGEYDGGFDIVVRGTAPVFWLFFLMTGVSLFVLRNKDHAIQRTFRVPLYPFVPGVFCLTCAYMLYSSVAYARELSLLGIVPLALGVPLYFVSRLVQRR